VAELSTAIVQHNSFQIELVVVRVSLTLLFVRCVIVDVEVSGEL
jgi:hypothetical protein